MLAELRKFFVPSYVKKGNIQHVESHSSHEKFEVMSHWTRFRDDYFKGKIYFSPANYFKFCTLNYLVLDIVFTNYPS